MAQSPITPLLSRIEAYKRKFYLNRLVKGLITSSAVILSAFLVLNTLEYFGHFGTTPRAVLFFAFVLGFGLICFFWIIKPLIFLYGKQKPLSDEVAAQQIGHFFPEIADKLLNTLQLSATLGTQQNELLLASIEQKSQQLGIIQFADAIKLNQNRKYLKYAILPSLILLVVLLVYPAFITKSTERIVHFKNEYQEEAPFHFILENKSLQAFKNEDFSIRLTLQGNTLPEAVYVLLQERKLKMESLDNRHFTFTFSKIQEAFDFQLEAAGFKSGNYAVEIINKPSLAFFDVNLNYPAYLHKTSETMANSGNITVPEGTNITWDFKVSDTDAIDLIFENPKKQFSADKKLLGGGFDFTYKANQSGNYTVVLHNQYASTKDGISFNLQVIPDKYPQLNLEQYKDSTLYNYMVLGGSIADDYGLSKLAVYYKVIREGKNAPNTYRSFNIPIQKNQSIQSFYQQWNLDSLKLNPSDKVEYYVQVWDNDEPHGFKSTRSSILQYAIPNKKTIEKAIDNTVEQTKALLDKTYDKAQKLRKEITSLENRLKNKKDLDFQDKKLIEEIAKKKEDLISEIKKLQEQNQNLNEQQQRFNETQPEQKAKLEALQKLMEQLLDPATQKIYEEMKKMLEQNPDDPKILDQMDKLRNRERNMEKELERLQNLFKKMQVDQKLEKSIQDLQKLAEKEEQLSEQNQNLDKQANEEQKQAQQEQVTKEQEKLSQEFQDIQKELNEAEKLNDEIKNSNPLDLEKNLQEDIRKEQQESVQKMNQKQSKAASDKQKKAANKMRELSKKLEDMQMEAEMKSNMENMDDLRAILENLVKLSFDQEKLMKDFRGVNPSDPRFIKLAQEQVNLQDDAKIVEDSLYALAKRVLQIESVITRELTNMKSYMGDAVKLIKDRRMSQISAKQQFSMASINNLALLLSDVLKQMQENQQQMMMMSSGKKKSSKPNQQQGLGKRQEMLNQQMQQSLQKGQQGGKSLSEELAKMAREQAQIRKMLQQFLDNNKGTEKGNKLGNEVKELMKKMEESETDLVNKRLNPNLINRQKEVLTRLLESEKAMQEQEEDQKRKAETANSYAKKVPPQFQQYVKDKQKQTELLKTVPPNLNPYYKQQVDAYFKRIQ